MTFQKDYSLRPFQQSALNALRNPQSQQNHILCVSPTGSGKSLIYEREATRVGQRTLLITPLVALARQQFAKLKAYGLEVHLGAGRSPQGPPRGETGIWIISPESLNYPSKLASLKRWSPNFLVVDECHCLWEWGENFRPAFTRIPRLVQDLKVPKSLWLTATLPVEARKQLRECFPQPLVEIGAFDLPSGLFISVQRVPWENRTQELVRQVLNTPGPGLIFVATRQATERVGNLVRTLGKRTITYHGGMSDEERRNYESLVSKQIPDFIVATSAFGMGMDYSHLTHVILWQAPTSLLSLVQTVGRVGRDQNAPGLATIFWEPEDFRLLEWTTHGSQKRKAELMELLQFMNTPHCRRSQLKFHFDRTINHTPCQSCDVCCQVEPIP